MNLNGTIRGAILALALLAGSFWIAPSALARVHVGVGIGLYGPGYAVGINSGCWRCGYGYYGYVAPPVYYPAPAYPAPVYYGPTYYPAPIYYRPAYYTVPGYYGYGYYAPRPYRSGRHGHYYRGRGGYHGRGAGYHHRGHR